MRLALSTIGLAVVCAGCRAPTGDAPSSRAAQDESEWLTYADPQRGIAFRYPRDFGTAYIHALDWPPLLRLLEGPLQCTEAGSETARAGRTERVELGGRRYCVTRVTEGAAGSVYTSYAYAFELDGDVAILTFSSRAVQCGNYDEPQKSECETERVAFDANVVVEAMARTVELDRLR